jgi:hypothetical protein
MKPKIIGKLRNNKWYQMEKIDFKTLLAIFLIIIIFFGLQQVFGGNIFDFFSHGESDEDRKQEIYKIVEFQVYNFKSNDVFGIYDDLDVIGLTNSLFEQEKIKGIEYSELTIKMMVNNESIDLLLDKKEELSGRGNLG